MVLNNCTTCGRKPEIQVIDWFHYAQCKCGKHVSASGGNIWSAEVAADMWNRANPVPVRAMSHINYLADLAAKSGPKPVLKKSGYVDFIGGSFKTNSLLAHDLMNYRQELTDFYKNRLQTEARA